MPRYISIFEILGLRAFCLVALAGPAHAQSDGAHEGAGFVDAVREVLTPPLAAVLEPTPPVLSDAMEDKLAWVAELARRADEHRGYSRMTAWRTLMAWPDVGDGAAPDTSLRRYPVPGGRLDPALDFRASVALAWLDPHRFSCDFPLRARFLVDHGLVRGPLPLEEGKCKAFERWADLERLEAIDVMYATPSWSDPSASMGHILFRIRHSGAKRLTGPSFEPVFAYAAIDDPETPLYLLKGLVGELTASMTFEVMGEVQARYGQRESRDLILYELKLDARERRFLLAEVYAQRMKKMAVPYAFLTTNCATLAHELMRAVIPELPRKTSFLMHPHEVVSALLESGRAKPIGMLPSDVTRTRAAERVIAAKPDEVSEIDAAIDLELWALGRRAAPNASSPRLDALLDRRAQLPIGRAESAAHRVLPTPDAPVARSGSRARALAVGLDDRGRLTTTWTMAVMDEPLGAPRVALLKRSGLIRLLASETTASWDGTLRLERQRLVVLSTTTLGDLPRSALGVWGGLGFATHLEMLVAPGEGLDFAAIWDGGPALTLAASEDFGHHLGLALRVELSAWSHAIDRGQDGRVALGPELFAGVRLGHGHTLRVSGRARPGWSFPAGWAWGLEGEGRLDVMLSRSGLFWRTTWSARWDTPRRDGWELSTGLAF